MVFCLPISARVVTDRVSGYSKGFGFVQYATLEDAAKGIEGMDGKVRFIKPVCLQLFQEAYFF
jgi:RNA recognition motif-containing protein